MHMYRIGVEDGVPHVHAVRWGSRIAVVGVDPSHVAEGWVPAMAGGGGWIGHSGKAYEGPYQSATWIMALFLMPVTSAGSSGEWINAVVRMPP